MKLLVFGHGGQLATELRALQDADLQIEALDRCRADLTVPGLCARRIEDADADAVVNAAAYTAVDRAEDETDLAERVNGAAPAEMARAAAARDLPFLHVSTDYVFHGTGQGAHKPDDLAAPLGAYGRSKLLGEEGVRAAAGRHVILRTSWVFSAHGANFVKTMLRLSETRDQLSVVDDQIGGPTSARDIARTLIRMARALCDGQEGGTYHYAGAPATDWAGFARETFSLAGRAVAVTGIPTSNYPTPARRPLNSRLDCSSLQADFAITPPDWRVSLGEVIKELEKS